MAYAPWVVIFWFLAGLAMYGWLKAKKPATLIALENEMEMPGQNHPAS
jgi:hypothetical protein